MHKIQVTASDLFSKRVCSLCKSNQMLSDNDASLQLPVSIVKLSYQDDITGTLS